MSEFGKYEKLPRPESISTFIKYLKTKKNVTDVTKEGEQLITVNRRNQPDITIFMTNCYIVTIADVYDILNEANNIDGIVTLSPYNSYTDEAKTYCKDLKIGLFRFSEFMGAVYFDGQKYLDYIPKEERDK